MEMLEAKVDTHPYQALSFGDKLRAARFLSQGDAPSDPGMATAVVALGERYRAHGRAYAALIRWLPLCSVIVFGAIAIPEAIDGNIAMTIVTVLLVLGSIGHLALNPAVRPKNLARSLEASRRVVEQTGHEARGETVQREGTKSPGALGRQRGRSGK